MSQGNFTSSPKGNRKLEFKDFLYNNKSINISKGINKGFIMPRFQSLGSPEPPPLSESLGSPEPPPLSGSLDSSKPLTLSETLAYLMPVAWSIFAPTTPCHPAHIGHPQSLTPQSFRTFVPPTASFVMLQVASNDAHIIPPPPQFADALFFAHFCRQLLK